MMTVTLCIHRIIAYRVPIFSNTMHGQDSLLSIVQMPRGIPVATVAIGNASNAGLLAVRTLSAADATLLHRMERFMMDQESDVLKKADRLQQVGYRSYLDKNLLLK